MHGDDFTIAGPPELLDWFKQKLEERYELKENAGLGEGGDKEAKAPEWPTAHRIIYFLSAAAAALL